MDWKKVGIFLIGTVLGSGVVFAVDTITGVPIICTCTKIAGSSDIWNPECPAEVKNEYGTTCP